MGASYSAPHFKPTCARVVTNVPPFTLKTHEFSFMIMMLWPVAEQIVIGEAFSARMRQENYPAFVWRHGCSLG